MSLRDICKEGVIEGADESSEYQDDSCTFELMIVLFSYHFIEDDYQALQTHEVECVDH